MSIYLRKDGRYVVKFKDGNAWKQKTFRAREDAEGFERSLKYDEIENTRLTVAESILLFLVSSDRSMDPLNDRLLDPPHQPLGGAGEVGM